MEAMRREMQQQRKVIKTTWGLTKAIRQSLVEITETTEVVAHDRRRYDEEFALIARKVGVLKRMISQVTVSEV